ncbi:MAG: glutamate racemase [Bacteroidales bacterium]
MGQKREFSIGIFDSGYGGLTVFKEIQKLLPRYNYIYLGDNARSPYGKRTFNTIYNYTLQAVKALFAMDCYLIIIACNTASAKALRTIQMEYLPTTFYPRRVLGVIRPTTEQANTFAPNGHIGVFGTQGTVLSNSYVIEINKLYPNIIVTQEACPMWVPLIENNEHETLGAQYFIEKHVNNILIKDKDISSIILGCTHYPIIKHIIKKYLPTHIRLIDQGEIVAKSLEQYLINHPEIEQNLAKDSIQTFYTTDDTDTFDNFSATLLEYPVTSRFISID